ncbi:MAG: hypothetical protein ACO3A2_02930, partial [Bdellovibrionia bacterium]
MTPREFHTTQLRSPFSWLSPRFLRVPTAKSPTLWVMGVLSGVLAIGPNPVLAQVVHGTSSQWNLRAPSVPPSPEPDEVTQWVRCVQEWNQLIPQGFRDIPIEVRGQAEKFDFVALRERLNELEYSALRSNLAALIESPSTQYYLAANAMQQRNAFASWMNQAAKAEAKAQANQKGGVDPVGEAVTLEKAHTQLAVNYPGVFTDQVQISVSHPLSEGSASADSSDVSLRQRHYLEAFEAQTPIHDAYTEALSQEPGETGWVISYGSFHLPTVQWVGGAFQDRETQMISENAARVLSSLAGVALSSDSGIVFGKLRAGWKLEFSGRAEAPVYLSRDLKPLGPSDTEMDRYFVFLNAVPGAHLMFLESLGNSSSGAVAFPVLSQMATYLDLTSISYAQFSGRVSLSESADSPERLLSGASVRIVGQPKAAGVTGKGGVFSIDPVLVVSDYPLFAETDKGNGFTHRYRILPKNLQNITLHRISRNQVQDWMDQVEGG